jgi:hypothetical protein
MLRFSTTFDGIWIYLFGLIFVQVKAEGISEVTKVVGVSKLRAKFKQ